MLWRRGEEGEPAKQDEQDFEGIRAPKGVQREVVQVEDLKIIQDLQIRFRHRRVIHQ